MTDGYSGRPLVRKLGIEAGFAVRLVDAPGHYRELLGPLPPGVTEATRDRGGPLDLVHLFATERSALEEGFARYRPRIAPAGMIWASWPKKSSGVETELDGNVVREAGLAAGLVDVKVCAVDEVWSALKFVIRREDR